MLLAPTKQTESDLPADLEAAVLERMKLRGETYADAKSEVEAEWRADADRLAAFIPDAAVEVAKANLAATTAAQKAAALRAESQARLDQIESQIAAVETLRRKIAAAKSLCLTESESARMAELALNYWTDARIFGSTMENESGFQNTVKDLLYRSVLNDRVTAFIAPIEKAVVDQITEIKATAKKHKIDLGKVVAKLATPDKARFLDGIAA